MRCPGPLGSCSMVCPPRVLLCVCGVLGNLAPVHRCARVFFGVASAVSWATSLLFTGVPAWFVVLHLRCLRPLASCSPVCPLRALLCSCGVPGHLAPVHRCARTVCCVASVVSWATWLLFTSVPAPSVALLVRCPPPLGSCSPLWPLGVWCCVCGVLRYLAPVHRCARSVCCFAYAVSWATCLLFTGVPTRCVVSCVRCPGPLGSCSPVCPLSAFCCVYGVLRHLAPVHRCARSVCCFACAVSWATWLLVTGVPARCVALRVWCPGPLGSYSPVCPLGAFLCVCDVLGDWAPVHRCARSVYCFACAVSWATRLLFTGVHARCVALRMRCPGPPGSCSPVCPLGALLCVCGVLGHLAPVHRCARVVCCVACAASARCVVLRVRCPGPLGSCSPLCPLGASLCVFGVLGHFAPVHRCARSVCCFACAVSWATWLLFTGVPAWFVVLRVRRPLGALFCVCGVLGHLAPVNRCARSVRRFACLVSWATWLLFTAVPARCVALRLQCPGPLGSCSPVCPLCALLCQCVVLGHLASVHRCARVIFVLRVRRLGPLVSCSPVCLLGVLCRVCGVLGHLAPVHWCARVVCCVASAMSSATWLLFIGVPAPRVALLVRCPGPLGSRSLFWPHNVLCCVCGVLGHVAPVHRCARSVRCFARAASSATWLLFTSVPAWFVVLHLRCRWPRGSCSPVCPLRTLLCSCGVPGHLAPVHRCARTVCCVASMVSWATWLLFTGVPALSVALLVRCPRPLGSCSPVCPLSVWCCVCGVLRYLAPVHRCARSVCCFAYAVSWATWLLFTGVPTWLVVLRVPRPGPLGSCSPACLLDVLCLVCGVLGHLAPVHRCARVVCCVACASSGATWLLFTAVPARCVALLVRCPGLLGSCSPVCLLDVLCCVCGVLGHLAPIHRCARSVRSFACAVSLETGLLFTDVPARCIALRVRCPGPLGSCSTVFPLGVLLCVCGVLGYPAPVHRCARSVRCFSCAVSWATWLLFTGVPTWPVVLRVRRLLGLLLRVCGVLGHLAAVQRCPRSVHRFACAVSLATWLLFTALPARCVTLLVRCPGPLGSCSPVCPLCALLCVCVVLGHLAPVHRSARVVCCVACAASWATCLLVTGVPARCVVSRVRCPGPLGSCSLMCPRGLFCCICGVFCHLAPVHRCARFACCFARAVSRASWLLFTVVPAQCVLLQLRCPGPLGSCSPLCPLRSLLCWCGVFGHLASVHRCGRVVCCVASAVSSATWLLFTCVPAPRVALLVRCPGSLGSRSPLCPHGVLCCVCGVLGHLAPVHRRARSVRCFARAVTSATWLLFTGVPARCVVLRVRCPALLGSCSPVCPLGVLLCVCGVLGHLAPVHRCARSVRCFACVVSRAAWLLFTGVPTWCVV